MESKAVLGGGDGEKTWCRPSANNFSIRTTCPHPKFLTETRQSGDAAVGAEEQSGQVSFTPFSGSSEQYWRLSQPPPQSNFDFL